MPRRKGNRVADSEEAINLEPANESDAAEETKEYALAGKCAEEYEIHMGDWSGAGKY